MRAKYFSLPWELLEENRNSLFSLNKALKSILTTFGLGSPCDRAWSWFFIYFWHLLVHLLEIIAAPITQGVFYWEILQCDMPYASAYDRSFFQGTSSFFSQAWGTIWESCQKSSLTNTFFYILWASLVFVWPSPYALTYGINKWYKCSQFMPSCEAHTKGCKLHWDKTAWIICIDNQNHPHLTSCWQFSTLNEFWLCSVLFSWGLGHSKVFGLPCGRLKALQS